MVPSVKGGCRGYVPSQSFNSLKGLGVALSSVFLQEGWMSLQDLGFSSEIQHHQLGLVVHICHPR